MLTSGFAIPVGETSSVVVAGAAACGAELQADRNRAPAPRMPNLSAVTVILISLGYMPVGLTRLNRASRSGPSYRTQLYGGRQQRDVRYAHIVFQGADLKSVSEFRTRAGTEAGFRWAGSLFESMDGWCRSFDGREAARAKLSRDATHKTEVVRDRCLVLDSLPHRN